MQQQRCLSKSCVYLSPIDVFEWEKSQTEIINCRKGIAVKDIVKAFKNENYDIVELRIKKEDEEQENFKENELFPIYSLLELGLENSSVDDLIDKDFKPEDLQTIKSCAELFKSKKLRERYPMSHLKESLESKNCTDLKTYMSLDEYIDDPLTYSLEKLVNGK